MMEIAQQITVFLDLIFCLNGHKKNSAQTDIRRQRYKAIYPREYSVTEFQNHRVTESESHTTSTPYSGG